MRHDAGEIGRIFLASLRHRLTRRVAHRALQKA
jgi:hypothetical protein